jgi:NhaA family Na+:H+ antiporter
MANSSQTSSSDPNASPVESPRRRGVQRILAPVERFLAIESASGIVLMIAAVVALLWANSPWSALYTDLWHIPVGIRLGDFSFDRDVHFLINEGLMTIFFFVVGLEIRREIHAGELSDVRRAALPVAAAVGGMVAPAIIFLVMNAGRASAAGWAVPMATDIAFAVGTLTLLGKRVTPSLRILLLALAVIDDVGAILVIAVFYSSDISAQGFLTLAAGILVIRVFQRAGIRSPVAYILPAIVMWAGTYSAGIHATLSGVMVGFLTPVTAGPGANSETVSPVERLQQVLHGWVAFVIMPLFAFANAGVPVSQISWSGDGLWVFLGVAIGLCVGKPIGIVALSWIAVRNRAASLPNGVRWSHMTIVGMVGGIGFTMALFIAQLAFPAGPLLETAKAAILLGSAVAAVAALSLGYRVLEGKREG